MFGFQKIVEKRIKEAQERGEFDNLPGRGAPIVLEDDSHIPEDLRLAYKILKNAGCLPPELELKKKIRQMEDMLENIPDEKERYRQIRRINYKILQLNMMGKKSPLLEEKEIYHKKLIERFGRKRPGPDLRDLETETNAPYSKKTVSPRRLVMRFAK
jgi:hypothetical protein